MPYHILLTHSSVNEHLHSFHFLTVTNSTNIWVQVFVWTHVFISFGCIRRNGNARSSVNSIFKSLRNYQTILKQTHHLIFPPAVYRGSNLSVFSLTLSSIFFILALLMSVKWFLIVVLICVSPKANGVEHLICVYCLFLYIWKVQDISVLILCPLVNWIFCFFILN